MQPVRGFLVAIGAMALLAALVALLGLLFKKYGSAKHKQELAHSFARLKAWAVDRNLPAIAQDSTVLIKSLFASLTICFQLPTGARCKLEPFTYYTMPSGGGNCTKPHTRFWPPATELERFCAPDNSVVDSVRYTLYVVIAMQMVFFVWGLRVKNSSHGRWACSKNRAVTAFIFTKGALLFAFLKLVLILGFNGIEITFSCGIKGLRDCHEKWLSWFPQRDLDSECCLFNEYNMGALRDCGREEYVSSCHAACPMEHLPYEVYVLMLNSFLTFVYITYMMKMFVEGDEGATELAAEPAGSTGHQLELTDQDGLRYRLLAHEQGEASQKVEEVEMETISTKRRDSCSPRESTRLSSLGSAEKLRKSYRWIRNMAAFAKYMLTVISLSLLLDKAVEAEAIKSACNVKMNTYPYDGIFFMASALGVAAFLYGTLLATTGRNHHNAKLVALNTFGLMAFATMLQIMAVLHLKELPATFRRGSYESAPPVFETFGVSSENMIDVGTNTTHFYVECGAQCHTHVSWSVILLLCNMLLSLVFMLTNLLDYYKLAKQMVQMENEQNELDNPNNITADYTPPKTLKSGSASTTDIDVASSELA